MILTITWIVLLVLGVLGLYVAYFGRLKDATEIAAIPKGLFAIISVAMLTFGLIQVGGFKAVGIPLGPFGVTPTTKVVYQQQPTTTTVIQQVPSGQPAPPSPTSVNRQQPIQTFRAILREKYSNKYDAVGNSTYGYIEVYPSDQDPQAPTSEYIIKVNVTSGAGSATNPGLTTDSDYRVVFDGGGLGGWYDEDWGVIQFAYDAYQKNTGEFLFSPDGITRIATIDDILDADGDTDGDINGQTAMDITQELNATDDDTLVYNCTTGTGDGNFYVQPTLGVSGGNQEIKDFVMCFDWDDTNPPEGDEISDITYQLVSGTDFGIPSNMLDHWAKEACIDLGANVKGGTSSKIKLSITVDETALDANDDWYLRIDDLGGWQAKDKKLNKGATFDTLGFDSYGTC